MWSKRTTDGSRSDLDFRPFPSVWEAVQSEDGNCLGRECPRHKECFFYRARRRAQNANMLIVNHALFVTDLALRGAGFRMLPKYESRSSTRRTRSRRSPASTSACSSRARASTTRWRGCTTSGTDQGLARGSQGSTTRSIKCRNARTAADDFFDRIADWYHGQPTASTAGSGSRSAAGESSRGAAQARHGDRRRGSRESSEKTERIELDAAEERCRCAGGRDLGLAAARRVERGLLGRGRRKVATAGPAGLGAAGRRAAACESSCSTRIPTCVLTSATLCVGSPPRFDFITVAARTDLGPRPSRWAARSTMPAR